MGFTTGSFSALLLPPLLLLPAAPADADAMARTGEKRRHGAAGQPLPRSASRACTRAVRGTHDGDTGAGATAWARGAQRTRSGSAGVGAVAGEVRERCRRTQRRAARSEPPCGGGAARPRQLPSRTLSAADGQRRAGGHSCVHAGPRTKGLPHRPCDRGRSLWAVMCKPENPLLHFGRPVWRVVVGAGGSKGPLTITAINRIGADGNMEKATCVEGPLRTLYPTPLPLTHALIMAPCSSARALKLGAFVASRAPELLRAACRAGSCEWAASLHALRMPACGAASSPWQPQPCVGRQVHTRSSSSGSCSSVSGGGGGGSSGSSDAAVVRAAHEQQQQQQEGVPMPPRELQPQGSGGFRTVYTVCATGRRAGSSAAARAHSNALVGPSTRAPSPAIAFHHPKGRAAQALVRRRSCSSPRPARRPTPIPCLRASSPPTIAA
jgi:hypothetical protein